jgi:hypothetical protein
MVWGGGKRHKKGVIFLQAKDRNPLTKNKNLEHPGGSIFYLHTSLVVSGAHASVLPTERGGNMRFL